MNTISEKIKSGVYMIVKSTNTSDVWKYFYKVVQSDTLEHVPFATCGLCEQVFKFDKGASTSNLKKHKCYVRQIKEVNSTVPFIKKERFTVSDQIFNSSNLKKVNSYKRQNEEEESSKIVVSKKVQISVSDQIREEVVQNCVKFVARDLQSCDTVNGNGFKELARSLVEIGVKIGTNNFSISDILPHRTTVSCRINKLHDNELELFIANLRPTIERGMCAGTMDIWTDIKKQKHFLAFTVHYLDKAWHLHSRILFTVEFESCNKNEKLENYSAESIIRSIDHKFIELNLGRDMHKKITFTTDPDIKIALQNHLRVNCVVHVLKIILRQVFDKEILQERAPHILDLINKCKFLVRNLKRTGKILTLETTGMQEPSTWWNTKFDMLYAVRKHFNAIEDIFEQSDESHCLIGIEKILLDRVLVFLEPFKCATLLLEGESNPTIHLVLLHMQILKDKLLKLQNEKSNDEVQSLVSYCLDNIFNVTFKPDKIHKIAAFLWPQYKQMRYLSDRERQEVYNLVKEELLKISVITPLESSPSSQTEKHEVVTCIEEDVLNFDDMLAKYKDVHSGMDFKSESEVNLEMSVYKDSCYPENNILDWWRLHEKEFPLLAKLARNILCIPASSGAGERCFSSSSRILEERRSHLESENLDAILFLHSQQK